MKKTFLYLTSLTFLALLFLTSCEDKIELDLPEGETLLVVQGFITNEERPHAIHLTYTSPYFSNAALPRATGATVLMRDDLGSETLLEEMAPGVYTYPMGGDTGRSYQLDIALPNGERYQSGYELLKPVPPVLNIRSVVSERGPNPLFDEEPDQIYSVLFDTFEPPGVGDFYRWRYVINGEELSKPFDIFIASDEFVDGNPIIDFDLSQRLYFAGDTITIIQESISAGLYDFLTVVQQQTAFVGGPFDTPPASIKSNVKNVLDPTRNALGYFAATGRDSGSIVVGE